MGTPMQSMMFQGTCAEVMKYIKTKCNEFCAHIHILPVYHLSLPAQNSHHGSFGRGVQDRSIDCRCVPPPSTALALPQA